jgi:hypothetical protein
MARRIYRLGLPAEHDCLQCHVDRRGSWKHKSASHTPGSLLREGDWANLRAKARHGDARACGALRWAKGRIRRSPRNWGRKKCYGNTICPSSDQRTAGTPCVRAPEARGRRVNMSKVSKKVAKCKTLLDLESNDCRWPIGEPRQPDFHFCGKPHVPGRPYCELHWSMAFQPPRPRHQRPAIQPPTAPTAKAA